MRTGPFQSPVGEEPYQGTLWRASTYAVLVARYLLHLRADRAQLLSLIHLMRILTWWHRVLIHGALGIFGLGLADLGQAQGIPEPDVVYYGVVRNTGQFNARVTSGVLNWKFEHLSAIEANRRSFAMTLPLSDLLGQFSYVMRVPCETSLGGAATSTNAAVLQLLTTTNHYRSSVSVDGHPATFTIAAQTNVVAAQTLRGRVERVDLTVDLSCDDKNPNGPNRICDWWEFQHFGDWVNAQHDPDGDGTTNLEEFLAGTDPRDPASVFIFTEYGAHPAGGFQVVWQSSLGRSYTLERFDRLVSATPDEVEANLPVIVRAKIPATPPLNSFLDTNAVPPGPYFYRLRLDP